MTEKAQADVKESIQAIEEYEKEIKDIQAEKDAALEEANEHWEQIASQMTEIQVAPYKKDIQVEMFGVAWYPHFVVRSGSQIMEVGGYSAR